MDEVWEYIEGFPEYSISDLGRVINIKYGRFIRPQTTDRGYKKVTLQSDFVSHQFYVHQLVAEAFICDYRKGLRVNHRDDDYSNNAVTNLRVLSGSVRGESRYASPRLNARRVMIVETGEVFRTAYDLARHIGGRASNVYRCLNGYRGSHMGYHFEYLDIRN